MFFDQESTVTGGFLDALVASSLEWNDHFVPTIITFFQNLLKRIRQKRYQLFINEKFKMNILFVYLHFT